MHIHITTTTAELTALGMSREELAESVRDALIDHACGADGEAVDLGEINVATEIIPTAAELFNAPGSKRAVPR